MKWALEACERIIKGGDITVHTDHQALTHLTTCASPKLMRYALRIAEFAPRIVHVSGRSNEIADWLSRCPTDDEDDIDLGGYALSAFPAEVPRDELVLPSTTVLHDAAKADTDPPPGLVQNPGLTLDPTGTRLYIPKAFRHLFLFLTHGSKYSGHIGVGKVSKLLRKHFWWPSLQSDVEDYVRSCVLCQCLRPVGHTLTTFGSLETIGLSRVVSVDYVGPRVWFGKPHYILVCVDQYSRFMMAQTSESSTADFAIKFLDLRWRPVFGALLV